VSKDVPIVIVGAGAAGLSAARYLLDSGRKVLILEANDYIGGRVKSWSSEETGSVELGASVVHFRDKKLFEIAKQRGMLAKKKLAMRFMLNGESVVGFSLILRLKFVDLFKVRKVFQYFYSYRGEDVSLTHLFDMAGLSSNTRRLFCGIYSSALGVWLENIGINSIRNSFKRGKIRFEREVTSEAINGEYLGLLSDYVDAVLPFVQLNSPVIDVDYQGEMAKVTLVNGDVVFASHVIITVPLSILKAQAINFVPPLPLDKQGAIEKLGMGVAAKIVLVFSEAFWGRKVGYLIGCNTGVMFFVQNEHEDQHVLVAYVYDAELVAQNDSELLQSVIDRLDACYASLASQSLQSSHVHNWLHEKYIAGGYSYDAIGSEGCRDVLAESVMDMVYFAGEACINGYAATVDGALLSGERVAKDIELRLS